MTLFQKLVSRLASFMSGRNGIDQLAVCTLAVSLILQVIASFTGSLIILILSIGLYAYTIFRILSKKRYKRQEENAAFITWFEQLKTKSKQFFLRLKLRKDYKYFRCPQCKTLIRIKRGSGERAVICPNCKSTFRKKA